MWINVRLFLFKQKTAYELRISDWSSDVCSSDLRTATHLDHRAIRTDALEQVRGTSVHVVDAFGHMAVHFAGAALAQFGVPADQVSHRHADVHHAVGIVEQFQITPVPRHQSQDRKSTRLNSSQ